MSFRITHYANVLLRLDIHLRSTARLRPSNGRGKIAITDPDVEVLRCVLPTWLGWPYRAAKLPLEFEIQGKSGFAKGRFHLRPSGIWWHTGSWRIVGGKLPMKERSIKPCQFSRL